MVNKVNMRESIVGKYNITLKNILCLYGIIACDQRLLPSWYLVGVIINKFNPNNEDMKYIYKSVPTV